jgi:hypothetical protein
MEYEDAMHALANEGGPLYSPTGRLRRAKGLTRADVIAAFQHSFEMIGGVPRLALWADANPTDFFKLYGRLLPSSSTSELDGPQELIIRHALHAPNYRASLSAPIDLHEFSPAASTLEHHGVPPPGGEDGGQDK